jgi:hypothetical protein
LSLMRRSDWTAAVGSNQLRSWAIRSRAKPA